MAEELRLDVKDFSPISEIHDDDRFMMTQETNAYFSNSLGVKGYYDILPNR